MKKFHNYSFPNEWEVKKIGKITKTFAGGTPDTAIDEYWGGDIPWMSSGELNQRRVDTVRGRITVEGLKNSSTRLIPENCVLIGLAGQGKTRGTVAVNKIELCTNQSIAAILPANGFITDYLFYNLDFRYEELRQLSAGDGGRGGLNLSIINGVSVPFPPVKEQKAIAHVLGLVDRAIELNNKIIAQKELRKKWLMQNLLTGQKRLKGFTGEWKEVQIGELLEPIYRYVEWNDDHVYKLVSIRRRYRGITERGNFHGHQIEVKKVKTIKENDFLISKRQVSHGAWALVSKDFHGFSVSDEYDCLTLRDVQKLDMGFWGWFCQNPQMSHYAYLASNGVHIEKLIFDYDTFKKRRVTIPVELAEQQQIASALTSADTELFLLARKTDQLREKKKWLMQQLLTGKRRIQILDE